MAILLAKAEKEKGDQALRKGDLSQAHAFYKEAVDMDSANPDYPRHLAQVTKLIDAQHVKSRSLTWAGLGLASRNQLNCRSLVWER